MICALAFDQMVARRPDHSKFEATGSPVITDGEQTKPSFATYPIHGYPTDPGGVKFNLRTGMFANFLNSPQGPFDIKPTHRATCRQRRNLRVFRLSKRSSLPQRLACCIRRTVFLTIHRKSFSKI
jgi:hypothetical protein